MKKLTYILLPLVAVFAVAYLFINNNDEDLIPPYIQDLTSTGVRIRFESVQEKPKLINYGIESSKNCNNSVLAKKINKYVHEGLITGLQPGTRYRYRVVYDDNHPEFTGTFRTAPVNSTPFRFGFFGDSRKAEHNRIPKNIVKELDLKKVDFIIHLGDFMQDDNQVRHFREPFKDIFDEKNSNYFGSRIPIYMVMGNHDVIYPDGSSSSHPRSIISEFLYYPNSGPWKANDDVVHNNIKKFYFSFDHGNCHFIILDYQGTEPIVGPPFSSTSPTQLEWLKNDFHLLAERKNPPDWIFAFFHVPFYHIDEKVLDVNAVNKWFIPVRGTLEPLFNRYGVVMAISGHIHNYQRTHPICNVPDRGTVLRELKSTSRGEILYDGSHTTYVISGGGGQESYPLVFSPLLNMKDDYAAKEVVHHYCTVEVDGRHLTLKAWNLDHPEEPFDSVRFFRE